MGSWEPTEALAAAARAGLDVDPARDGLVVQSSEGVILAATENAGSILGLSEQDLLGRRSSDPRWAGSNEHGAALPGEDHPSMRALAAGKPVRGAILGIYRSGQHGVGERAWLLVDSVPLVSPDGGACEVVSRFRLLTGSLAADLQTTDLRQLHEFLVETSPDIAAWQLADTTFLWVSPAVNDVLGYHPDELVGRQAFEFMHPEDEALARAACDRQWRGLAATTQVLRLRHRDGHYVALEVRRHVLRHPDGSAAQMRTAWRDVTARIDADHERGRLLRQMQAIIDTSPIGIAVCDIRGAIQQANPALEALLGVSPAELAGHNVSEYVCGRDKPFDPDTLGPTAQHSELQYRRKDGGTLWGWCTALLMPGRHGGPAEVLLHLLDVTQRHHHDEELQRAALTDPLTALPNRAGFEHMLHLTDPSIVGRHDGVLFIDIDDFKAVNDTHGHDAGDAVLQQVAQRIIRVIRAHDHAARFGGDEFVVFCPDVAESDVVLIADRLRAEMSVAFDVPHCDDQIQLSASVGTATAPAGSPLADLLATADRAMYRTKRSRGTPKAPPTG
ncbi:MAG: sensor domain-containing diguanylate cyclase [Mycobacterium kyogaense]|uniref:sensor domain-containing diguanylate cyclase n=1 Tax=Mycobacterium kyogaense TaxID=2212479 RepID=UPI002FF7003F